jgi:hypothetical protein
MVFNLPCFSADTTSFWLPELSANNHQALAVFSGYLRFIEIAPKVGDLLSKKVHFSFDSLAQFL